MNFLVLETSGEDSFVALFVSDGSHASLPLPSPHQSKTLLPALTSLLNQYHLSFDSLDFIAVGVGPGLFTGTRIGVMTAKTLNFAQKIPLLPFCSLTRFLPSREGSFLTLLDGKSEGILLLEGERQGEEVFFSLPSQKVKEEALAPFLAKNPLLLTPHLNSLRLKLKDPLLERPWEEATASLPFLAAEAKKRYLQGEGLSHSEVSAIY